MNMKYYTYSCKLANGQVYTKNLKGFNRKQVIKMMREDKEIFSGCSEWKLIKLN